MHYLVSQAGAERLSAPISWLVVKSCVGCPYLVALLPGKGNLLSIDENLPCGLLILDHCMALWLSWQHVDLI